MNNEKVWWQSRTIWSGVVGTAFAILSMFGWLPTELSSAQVVDAILGVTSILAVVFRFKAKAAIVPVTPAA